LLEGAARQGDGAGGCPFVLIDAEDAFAGEGDAVQFAMGAVTVVDGRAVGPSETGLFAGRAVLVVVTQAVGLAGRVRVGDGFAGLAVGVVIGGGAAGGLLADGAGCVGIAPGDQVVGVVPGEGGGPNWLSVALVLFDFIQPVGRIVAIGGFMAVGVKPLDQVSGLVIAVVGGLAQRQDFPDYPVVAVVLEGVDVAVGVGELS
jgi:hypothetical protein